MTRHARRLTLLVTALLTLLLAACGDHKSSPTTSTASPAAGTRSTVTVPVDGLDAGATPDRTIEVPAAAISAAKPDLEDDLQGEQPAGAPADQLDAARQAAAKIKRQQDPLPTAGATQGFVGCRTSFVVNQSSRRGVRPQVQVLHYTVSRNRPGWSDVDAIVALFNKPSFQASSNFVIDSEGHCAYIVPIENKAWTQAAGNPFSISYEIVAQGDESVYLQPAGRAKLRSVAREVAARTGIPLRRGAVSSCVPTRTGIVEHRDWGSCGGGHGDIAPFSIDAEVAYIASGGTTKTDAVTCRKLNWWRAHGRPGGKPARNAVRRRQALDKRGVTCTKTGPVKR